jgi:hypothetical protein
MFSNAHILRCPYCKLSLQIKQDYEWAVERRERLARSTNMDDIEAYLREVRMCDILGKYVYRMNSALDAMHRIRER